MLRCAISTAALLVLIAASASPEFLSRIPTCRHTFSRTSDWVPIRSPPYEMGYRVTKELPSHTPAQVFLLGAIYIHAAPEKHLRSALDFNRLRKLPNFLLGVFSNPPQVSDLNAFSFD